MWDQHAYGVGIWTKDKIDIKMLINKVSCSSIVSRTPKQNSYPCTINLSQNSSLSSLSHNNYKQRRKKKDKVSEYIEKMEKRLNKIHQRNKVITINLKQIQYKTTINQDPIQNVLRVLKRIQDEISLTKKTQPHKTMKQKD